MDAAGFFQKLLWYVMLHPSRQLPSFSLLWDPQISHMFPLLTYCAEIRTIYLFAGTLCLDVRHEACYTEYYHGQCTNPLSGVFSRMMCCCSSVGKAWGGGDLGTSRCESCPRPGTQAHQELCPKGSGFVDRKDINECTEFPGMCSNGRCKNTVGGFSCKCNQGFALDENGIKCIGELIFPMKVELPGDYFLLESDVT